MEITLEKIDSVMHRSGCGYRQAKEALLATHGDVLEALIYLEEKREPKNIVEEFLEKLRTLVDDGFVSQIVIAKNNRTIVDIPVVAGAGASLIFPVQTLALLVVALSTKCDINIVKVDGSSFRFTEVTRNKIHEIMDFIEEKRKEKDRERAQSVQEEEERLRALPPAREETQDE